MGGLSELFAPERVAVVGATERPGAVGRSITENLLETMGEGVVPINPNRASVLDRECYPDVQAAPPVDLAVVVLPAEAAIEAIERLGRAGVEHVVVISAGFGEAGGEGVEREQRLVALAEEHELNLVGPNCLGVMRSDPPMNATFGPDLPDPGGISLVSQSGAFITGVVDWALQEGIGFRDVVSIGNAAVLDATDFVEAWDADPETDVIVGYAEGIEDGRRFMAVCREVTRETPVVLLKAGRTEAGARAASSHTGSMAGSETAYRTGLEQAGVVRAATFEELFDAATTLATQPTPADGAVAVVTNAGGPGVMASDAVPDEGLSMAEFGTETREGLAECLPEAASWANPVDVLGDADAERFGEAIEVVLADENVHGLVVVSAPTGLLSLADLADAIEDRTRDVDIPVSACMLGGRRATPAIEALRDVGIPTYVDPARAVRSLGVLHRYQRITERDPPSVRSFEADRELAREPLELAVDRGEPQLGVEAMDLLEAYGIPTPAGEIVDDPVRAREVAADLGERVVLKLVSPDITHKTDVGGVQVGVEPTAVPSVYETMVARARRYQPDARILGVMVQELVDLDDATETILGMTRDPQFGPVLLFGLGGIFVEALGDTTARVAPVDATEARSMIEEVRAARLLHGERGRPPADVEAVVEAIERLSALAMDQPAILELEVNPLVAGPDGVSAIDFRATVDMEEL